MKSKADNPGVYIAPPLFYVIIFVISILIQKIYPIKVLFFESKRAFSLGLLLIAIGFSIVLPAIIRFYKTKNTLITIRPANSLQTSGIYSFSRNPMYLGLLTIYSGMAFIKGNIWTFILIPIVILVVSYFVILKEEKYLNRKFGNDYTEYKMRVRRWV